MGATVELAESIKSAWAAVEESGVPEHMQELAFRETLRSVLGSVQPAVSAGAGLARTNGDGRSGSSGDGSGEDSGTGVGTVDEATVMSAVSERTGVPVEKLDQVFHIDNGLVRVSVNHNALGKNAAEKARATAQIITVVRKVGMGDGDTNFDIIRDECQRKHFYDSKNFASAHMPGIDGYVVKGEGRNRRLEARNAGIASFPELIDKVLGIS